MKSLANTTTHHESVIDRIKLHNMKIKQRNGKHSEALQSIGKKRNRLKSNDTAIPTPQTSLSAAGWSYKYIFAGPTAQRRARSRGFRSVLRTTFFQFTKIADLSLGRPHGPRVKHPRIPSMSGAAAWERP